MGLRTRLHQVSLQAHGEVQSAGEGSKGSEDRDVGEAAEARVKKAVTRNCAKRLTRKTLIAPSDFAHVEIVLASSAFWD